jgi:hypothetical protein
VAVVLTILKILGIILLVLLALAILLIILVLAVPIRYRVKGAYNAEDINADVGVRWMIFRILGNFKKDEGLIVKVKVLFITIKTIKKDIGKKPAEVEMEVDAPPGDTGDGVDSNGHLLGSAEDKPAEDNPVTQEGTEVPGDGGAEEKPGGKPEEKPGEKTEEKPGEKPEENQVVVPDGEVVVETEGDEEDTSLSESAVDKLKGVWDTLETKKRHIECFFAKDYVKRTLDRGKKLLIKIFKHLKPKKGHVDLTMGLGSAADTGMMLGRLGRFYPLYGKWLFITPDFYYKRIEVEGEVKGRIRIGSIALPALFFYLKKDTRKTIRVAKKI